MSVYSFFLWAVASLAAIGLLVIFNDATGLFFVVLIAVAVAIGSTPKRSNRETR